MAQQTAAQRKAAEEQAQQERIAAVPTAPVVKSTAVDDFGSPQAAPSGGAGDSGAASDEVAQKLAEVERERDEAREIAGRQLRALAAALGIPEEGEGVDIYDTPDNILAMATERITQAKLASETSTATALRITLEEVDGAGAALGKRGVLIPIAQANPSAIGEIVKRSVEEIVGVPSGPVQALTQQSL